MIQNYSVNKIVPIEVIFELKNISILLVKAAEKTYVHQNSFKKLIFTHKNIVQIQTPMVKKHISKMNITQAS